jgi:hypothetical protein
MTGDSSTRDRLAWLDVVASHPDLDAGTFKLAYLIAGLVNRKTGDAWPSLDYLASAMRMNERSVRRLIEALVKQGFLSKTRGGDGRPNRYALVQSDRTPMSDQNQVRPDIHVHSDDSRPGTSVHSEISDRTSVSLRPDICVTQTGHPCPPISLNISLKDLSEKDIYRSKTSPKIEKGRQGDEAFEAFWGVYPRKVAKGTARKAWAKAVKSAEAEAIIAAAERYAAEQAGKDAQFTKHPATWLNAESWQDEPAPLHSTAPKTGTGQLTGKERTAAAIRAVMERYGGEDE